MQKGVFVSGIGTEVGKTIVSAILAHTLQAEYWKPVQVGGLHFSDSMKVERWTGIKAIHPERFRLTTLQSPHTAAAADEVHIRLEDFQLPRTDNFLIVEGAGGLMAPLNEKHCMINLIERLKLPVVLVSRHYPGSINHTLLSIEALRQRNIPISALIFNGAAHPSAETIIEKIAGVKALFRFEESPEINNKYITQLADTLIAKIQTLREGDSIE